MQSGHGLAHDVSQGSIALAEIARLMPGTESFGLPLQFTLAIPQTRLKMFKTSRKIFFLCLRFVLCAPVQWEHIVACASRCPNPARLGDPLERDDTISATIGRHHIGPSHRLEQHPSRCSFMIGE